MSEVVGHEFRPTESVPSGTDVDALDPAASLRWLRAGLSEETMHLHLPPDIRSSISPIITALRWGALLYGMVSASTMAANDGDLGVVVTLSVCLFLTAWRTFRPLRLAHTDRVDQWLPIIDAAILGGAAGLSDGVDSPFIFCVMVAIGVAAFGWGLRSGLTAVFVAMLALGLVAVGTGGPLNMGDVDGIAFLVALVAIGALIAYIRDTLISRHVERSALSSRVDVLTETNEMLNILNQVARTLPESMDMTEAANATQRELSAQFQASTIGLVVRDEATSHWLPMITDGCEFNETTPTDELPAPMRQALLAMSTISSADTDRSFMSPTSSSGLYTALRARGKVIGLLAVETDRSTDYDDREVRILDGLAGALALTIDNVRSFGRLRTMGADEERTRIARDLHDRLGQWLTYISLELERIIGEVPDTPSLDSLYDDVQTAIDELRETLRQLRTRVTGDEPLEVVGHAMAARFTERTGVNTSFKVVNPGQSLAVKIENELLRIMQEALNNVEKHAAADQVEVTWHVFEGEGLLEITDNGRGFDATGARRDTSYGLMGMRERADVIGATLDIRSTRGDGTTVAVRASNEVSVA